MKKKYASCFNCPECGDTLYWADDTGEYFECHTCNIKIWSYYLEDDTIDYSDWEEDDTDNIPEECMECGGPYPACTSSCSLFDD